MEISNVQGLMLVVGLLIGAQSLAQTDAPMMQKSESGQPLSQPIAHNLCSPEGVAVGGYDLLSYRQDGGPKHGNAQYSALYDGFTYLFADEINRDEFLSDPEQFLPGYDGFCAVTLALGRITCPDYTNFQIEDNRLLLFETTGFTNGKTLWNSDPGGFRSMANDNFTKINDQK